MRNLRRNSKGFTLAELLIYIGIFSMVTIFLTGIFIVTIKVQTKESSTNVVSGQLNLVLDTVQRLTRSASSIECVDLTAGICNTNTVGSYLKLRFEDSLKDPTCIYTDGDTVKLAEGPETSDKNLCTTDNTKITDLTNPAKVKNVTLQFTKSEVSGGHALIQVDSSMTYNSTSPGTAVTRSISAVIGRVSAATFDSNLLPNASTLDIGQASGNTWNYGYFGGGVGIGTTPTSGIKLEVNGSIKLTAGSGGKIIFPDASELTSASGVSTGGGWTRTSGKVQLSTPSDNVGINTDPGTFRLNVNGNATISGSLIVASCTGCGVGGGGGAPTGATYITQTADGALPNAQDLSALSTGYLKVTTGTGVLASAPAATVRSDIGAAETGSNSSITALTALTSITGMTTPLSVAQGGTGTNNGSITATGVLSLTSGGATAVVLRPGTNSTTAIQLQSSSGANILSVDSTNSRVGIGTAGPGATLQVEGGGEYLQVIPNSPAGYLRLAAPASHIEIESGGHTDLDVLTTSDYFSFQAGGVEKARISGTGVLTVASCSGCGGGGGLTVGTSTITSGSTTRVLYNNAGVLGEYTVSGSGNVAMTTSPTFVAPVLGTPASGTLTNATGLPISSGVSGLGTGVATFLGTPSSANLISAITDETGSGALVFATSPTLVTPALGTPASGTLTNATGLPISSGVSGLGTGVATFLATPSSANLFAALSDDTGTGLAVFGTAPTFSSTITVGTAGGTTGAINLKGTTSGTVTLTTAAAAGTYTLTLPTAVPTKDGQVLSATTGGVASWTNVKLYNQSVTTPAAGFAADTYVVGSSIAIPSGALKVGTRYHMIFQVSKTAAGLATPILNIRFGTGGVVGDASKCALTFTAQTAATDTGTFEVWTTFRSVGSGTSAVLQCAGQRRHGASVTGLGNLVSETQVATSAGFDSTVANSIIGASVNGGTLAAWTITLVQAELENLN